MGNYPPRLRPEEIKFIALEGGGGKGNAFVGALEALEHAHVNVLRHTDNFRLTNIRGISGASAGAITALFLSMGFRAAELKAVTEIEDFNGFLDASTPGRQFGIGGFRTSRVIAQPHIRQLTVALYDLVKQLDTAGLTLGGRTRMRRVTAACHTLLSFLHPLPAPDRVVEDLVNRLLGNRSQILESIDVLAHFLRDTPAAILNDTFRIHEAWVGLRRSGASAHTTLLLIALNLFTAFKYVHELPARYRAHVEPLFASLISDFGIFDGEVPYLFLRRWMAIARLRVNQPATYLRYYHANGSDIGRTFNHLKRICLSGGVEAALDRYMSENLSFSQFEREFGIKFVVTGTNLESFKSHIFSAATTPNFFVADAVRISMSLPYVFKPCIIRENDARLAEVLAPGENTREQHPISTEEEPHFLVGMWVDGGLFNNLPLHVFSPADGETLAIRLEPEVRSNIRVFPDYLKQYGHFLLGSGEALVSRTYDNKFRSINLAIDELDMLMFSPPPAIQRAVRNKALQYVFRYFNEPVPAGMIQE